MFFEAIFQPCTPTTIA